MAKKNPNAQATLRGFMLTNGEVDSLIDAGYLPIIRWVRKSDAFNKRKKLYTTSEAKAEHMKSVETKEKT